MVSPASSTPLTPGELHDLLRALREGNTTNRIDAAQRLGHTKDPAAIDALIATLHSGELQPLRKAAAHALVTIGTPAIRALITALANADDGIRSHAIYVFKLLGAAAIAPLIEAFASTDRMIRRNATQALKDIAGRGVEVVPALIVALHDESSRVRVYAAFVLSELVDPRAVEPLIDALHDENREAGLFIAAALSRTLAARDVLLDDFSLSAFDRAWKHFDASDTVPVLLETLNDANGWERLVAVIALGHTADARAVDPLLTLLCDDNGILRSAAAAALGNLGDPRAINSLHAAFDDPDVDIWLRRSAVYALGKIRDRRSFNLLLHAVRHTDHWRVRERALLALGVYGDPQALATLREALCDDDPAIRDAATDALVRFGDAAVPDLARALREPDECARMSAAEALERISTEDALAELELWRMKRRR